MKRYFLVSYVATTDNYQAVYGSATTTTFEGKYINLREFELDVCHSGRYNYVSVLNIIELSEGDYNEYVR